MTAMLTPPGTAPDYRTVADLIRLADHLGVPAERIRLDPMPGTATVEDVTRLRDQTPERWLCELVDGVLVEKTMGAPESCLAGVIVHFLWAYLVDHKLGVVFGADGMIRLLPDQVRVPDVAFFSWDQFPGRKLSREAVPAIYPDLAVEVLSPSNTTKEMDRKLADYFAAGTRLVWYLDPDQRSVRVFTGVDRMTRVDESGVLDGGDVLPGFRLPLADMFEMAGF